MSQLSKAAAWHILGAHALRSATDEEDEIVALEALSIVAGELGLSGEANRVASLAKSIRRICSQRVQLKEYFDGQLQLDMDQQEESE